MANCLYKWSKYKKLFFLASERPRTVLNAFLECMYFEFGLDGRTDGCLYGRRPYKWPILIKNQIKFN